ncbi:MAG: hypothetical protein KDB26_06870 [Microthrixaceae bacterium]|nr:hypothetical protein [Microthrixaceae bacterium]
MTDQHDDLDRRLAEDLIAATEHLTHTDTSCLATLLQSRRESLSTTGDSPDTDPVHETPFLHPNSRGRRSPRFWPSVAAALIVVSGVIGAVILANSRPSQRVSTNPGGSSNNTGPKDAPEPSTGFEVLGQGWHEIDLGPVPRGAVYSTTWYHGRLIVAASDFTARGDLGWTTALWSYDPGVGEWTELPAPDLNSIEITAAGDHLVAVGVEPTDEINYPPWMVLDHWATWTDGDSEWTARGEIPRSPQLVAAGVSPVGPDGANLLIWTGNELLDFTQGSVLSPATGATRPLVLPDNLVDFGDLLSSEPVFTGTKVVWPSPSGRQGLAWSLSGDEFWTIPAQPNGGTDASGWSHLTTRVFAVAGSAVVLDSYPGNEPRTSGVRVTRVDPDTGTETPLDPIENLPVPGCIAGAVTSEDRLLVVPCASNDRAGTPLVLRDGKWSETVQVPDAKTMTVASRSVTLTTAGNSVVLFSSLVPGDWLHTDRSTDEWKPRAAVWVPG